MTKSAHTFKSLLRQGGYKVTPRRLAILEALKFSGQPVSISQIVERLGDKMNPTTIYRALEALTDSGFVRKVNLQHPHTHYELIAGVSHHHHVICEQCGTFEDIENCDTQNLEKTALKKSKRFDSIKAHSLEFFGTCNKCSLVRNS